MGGSKEKHDWLQKKLYQYPEYLDVPRKDIICRTMEYELRHEGDILTIPDLYYFTNDGHTFVEIKSGNSSSLYSKGMSQLEKIMGWAEKNILGDFEARLVMPRNSDYTRWTDMLNSLNIYQLGDSYKYNNDRY